MRNFPIFLNLANRRVLVLGDGEVAVRKGEPLARAGAIVVYAARFEAADLIGCVLAVGADAPEAELLALSAAAQAAGLPVNVVDRPELCSFIMPAVVDRDPLTIAISSAGTAPVLARMVRARIELLLPPALGRLALLADSFKAELRRRMPDLARRRRVLDQVLAGPAAELVFAGREAEARTAFAQAIEAGDVPAEGIVFLVASGPGDSDLLTLRALRLMGEADAIVFEPDIGAAVLETARRDAQRYPVPDAAAAREIVVSLARAGAKIVRLLPGAAPGATAELVMLADLAIRAEFVPGVGGLLGDPAAVDGERRTGDGGGGLRA